MKIKNLKREWLNSWYGQGSSESFEKWLSNLKEDIKKIPYVKNHIKLALRVGWVQSILNRSLRIDRGQFKSLKRLTDKKILE